MNETRLQRVYERPVEGQRCRVPGCQNLADFTVALLDVWQDFYEQDMTCPFICAGHREENARRRKDRRPTLTNRCMAEGVSVFLPLRAAMVGLKAKRRTSRPASADDRCARCGKQGGELQLHHWAPVARFADGDDWPRSYLCRDCHTAWHREMGWRRPVPRKASEESTCTQ